MRRLTISEYAAWVVGSLVLGTILYMLGESRAVFDGDAKGLAVGLFSLMWVVGVIGIRMFGIRR